MKYDIDNNSWTTVESLMWFRDSTNLQGPAPAYAYYYDGYLYQNTNNEGISKAKVIRTDWESGRFPDLRDPVWGGQLGTQFPWIKLDTFGEIMPQQRYFQFKVELYSDNRSSSSVLEDVTVVTPQDIFIPASGTANLYLKVGVSPESQYEAWYSADRAGEAPGTISTAVTGDYSILYTKSSNGKNWGIATTASGAWDPANDSNTAERVGVYSPWVIKESASSYKLWFTNDYTGTTTGSYAGGGHIHYAESTTGGDLFNDRRVISEGVISLADGGVRQPCVIELSPSSYKIWYTGLDSSGVRRILSAVSTNGTTWTGHAVSLSIGRSVWDTTGAFRPAVLLEGSTYRMWYTGADDDGDMRILYTESTDGSSWIDPRVVIDIASEGDLDYNGCFHPFVLLNGTEYICYYIGYDTNNNKSVIYATSPDGLEWFNFQLVIPPGGLMETIDGNGSLDMFVILNRDAVVPGSMISGAQIKLYNDGAAI
jgi:(2Fe-2S) ferredoxin